MDSLVLFISICILIYFILLGGWYGLTLLTSYPDIISSYKEILYGDTFKLLEKNGYIPITIIMPAFNEKNRILNAIYSILNSKYPNKQIIIVNDGSTDDTLDLLIKEFSLYEIPPIIHRIIKTAKVNKCYKSAKFINLSVIDKEHGSFNSGADAINCGINALITPLFLTVDSDTVLEPDALTAILFRFLSMKNSITIGGVIYILNENKVEHGRLLTTNLPKAFIPAFQSIEYLRSFTYGRSGLNSFSGALCNPGAFTLNETNIVREVGGYEANNFAYDTEMTIKLHHLTRFRKYPTKIYFMSNAIAWTLVPSTLKQFWRQRNKWQRGILRSISKYFQMFLNPRYGFTGMIVFPAYIVFDLMAPVVEFIAYIMLVLAFFLNLITLANLFWCFFWAWGYIVIMTISSFYLNMTTINKFGKTPITHLIWLVTADMIGFRQFRAACCFFATIQYFFNRLIGKPL